ncbi:LysR substrate binding domain-containing protein, partial [Rhizobium sp. PP-F2F-G48]|uniref:LysR substrate-binding domain-containing protein n=1 Tax=Rhizobium sp. PP-F2F-G48 TaxID=2135651 RepID=UPI0010E3C194
LSTSNVIRKGSNASWRTSLNHKLCGLRRMDTPLSPHDLTNHNCINLRLPTNGAFYAWGFEKDGKSLRVRVEGQLAFNGSNQIFTAALDGCGLAYVPQSLAQPHVEQGRLVSVLEDWLPATPGYHLYYPTRRQSSAAFSLLVEALRYRS